ncbi:MAG: YceI family protein [Pseudomonadota bacterium]
MKKLLPFVAGLLLVASAHAQQKLVPAQSEIVFVSKQMGVPVEGRFTKFDAQIAFDPKKPEAGKASFTIDLASANLGSAETETELKAPGWFNSAKVPQASFASTSMKSLGGGKFEITGKLTIKGVTRDVVVPATLTQSGASTTAAGSFTIKRIDFKVGEGEWNDVSIVANDVLVKFKLALTGVPAL